MKEGYEFININLDIDVYNKLEKMAKINNIPTEEMAGVIATEGILQNRIKDNINKINEYMCETVKEIDELEELRKKYITSIESIKGNEEQ